MGKDICVINVETVLENLQLYFYFSPIESLNRIVRPYNIAKGLVFRCCALTNEWQRSEIILFLQSVFQTSKQVLIIIKPLTNRGSTLRPSNFSLLFRRPSSPSLSSALLPPSYLYYTLPRRPKSIPPTIYKSRRRTSATIRSQMRL